MAWEDLPSTALSADYSLPSWVTDTLQGNLDRVYEMSTCDHHSLGMGSYFRTYLSADVTWTTFGSPLGTPDWIGMPIPLRYQRDGRWRKINIECEAKTSLETGYIRPYLLAARKLDPDSIDGTDGVVGAEAYDEATIGNTFTKYTFSIDPTVTEVRHYEDVSLPLAWLHWIAKGVTGDYVYLQYVRWYEGLDS